MKNIDTSAFLPISGEDMKERGIEQFDFIYICGDAYVDHPSFGHAIITRLLDSLGFKVGIIPQPDWREKESFMILGKPKYAFLVSSGNIDSMVNHYTSLKRRRRTDLYSPGGKAGARPDRALIVYCNKLREAYKDVPIIIGGVEASLRRFAHYDYWDDKVRRSILFDSKADLLIYGMGEKPIQEIAEALSGGIDIKYINYVNGTAYITSSMEGLRDAAFINSWEEVASDKKKYAKAFLIQSREQDYETGKIVVQPHGDRYLVQNPPAKPLDQYELDSVYALPYARNYHPVYEGKGGIPALEEVKFSITSHRGCYGGCSFCALNFHQGRVIQKRSHESILEEAKLMTEAPDFKGYIHDVGGPTANFRQAACKKQEKEGVCRERQCMFPAPCKNLIVDHKDYLKLLREIRALPNIKKVFIRSGIRYDYVLQDKSDEFLKELCKHHVSGQLKVAPEHISEKVLKLMGKPGQKVYDRFKDKYFETNRKLGLDQYLVPYLMSGHPGSDLKAAVELAEYVRDMGYNPEQIQDFYPTPGSLSTAMYYTGLDPRTMEKVYVPKSPAEKAMQKALIQYRNPKNYDLVFKALNLAKRTDLIGYGSQCLIRPKPKEAFHKAVKGNKMTKRKTKNNSK
nr:YgiQ family radical SAM protein [Lutispora saccharofermentans]